MVPKNLRFACRIAAMEGLIPWINFEKKEIHHNGIYKIPRMIGWIIYSAFLLISFWTGYEVTKASKSGVIFTGLNRIMVITYICQLILRSLFVNIKKWNVIFASLLKFNNPPTPLQMKSFIIFPIIVVCLVAHYWSVNVSLKVCILAFCHFTTLNETLLCFNLNSLFLERYKSNNDFLIDLVKNVNKDRIEVQRYQRASQMRESGNVHRDIGRLVAMINSLIGKSLWFPIAAAINLFFFYSRISILDLERLVMITTGFTAFLVSM